MTNLLYLMIMIDTGTSGKLATTFKEQGLRFTLPRRVIIDLLADADEYLSAEEIFMRIHHDFRGIGLATVYRTLDLLKRMGIASKFEFGEGKARYELSETAAEVAHHHVIVCKGCFKAVKYSDFCDYEKKSFESLEKQLEKSYGFKIDRHVVHYYGTCFDCLKKQKSISKNQRFGVNDGI